MQPDPVDARTSTNVHGPLNGQLLSTIQNPHKFDAISQIVPASLLIVV
jgi:hypothetical protein